MSIRSNIYVVIAIVCSSFLMSCNKDEEEYKDKVLEDICGDYALESVASENGNAFDLNDDGIANTNILPELEQLENFKTEPKFESVHIFVYGRQNENKISNGVVSVNIFLQNFLESQQDQSPLPGELAYIHIPFEINNGKISFGESFITSGSSTLDGEPATKVNFADLSWNKEKDEIVINTLCDIYDYKTEHYYGNELLHWHFRKL